MILSPNLSPRRDRLPVPAAAAIPAVPVPAWLRKEILDARSLAAHGVGPNALEDLALAAGAAIGALDALVRRQERWAGVWRQRLALAAAALTARQARRVEDEAALRDAVLLTKPGDDVGPAGLLLLAWRRLADRPAEELLTESSLAAVLEEFGYACDGDAVGGLADELRRLGGSAGAVGTLTGASVAAERHGFGRDVGAWLADALLAQRLGWTHAVPLFGTEVASGAEPARARHRTSRATGIDDGGDRTTGLLAAQARAALRAIDLFADIERRAARLLAVAPKLRAKGSDIVVERLLSADAIVASQKTAGMSDRGLRRLFDRLVELGAVRELSGRPAFRIYGL